MASAKLRVDSFRQRHRRVLTNYDKGTGTGYYYLYRTAGTIYDVAYNAIIHNSYVTGGMSGGPILRSGSIISVNSTMSWGAKFGSTHINTINDWKALPY
jgi:hypothetical protein